MRLSPEQAERFYTIWRPLLFLVNERLHLVSGLTSADQVTSLPLEKVRKIRDALWEHDSLREEFIARNPAGLPPEDLALVESWRYRQAGKFFIVRHLKKHSIFIDPQDTVYGVVGLFSSFDEFTHTMPCLVEAVLLPFEGQITYDSLLIPYNIYFGGGVRRDLDHTYKDAKERGALITSLGPGAAPEAGTDPAAVNARVLEAFSKYLYRSGLSPRVVERDVANVKAFAEDYLARQSPPRSLRGFYPSDPLASLTVAKTAGQPANQQRQIGTSLSRLLRFLRDTERMDYADATAVLQELRRKE